MQITGNWKGIIIYGRAYRKLEGSSLCFKASLEQKGSNVSGFATDTEGTGLQEGEATIKGTINGDTLQFVKQYPARVSFDRNYNLVLEASSPGPEIAYSGVFDPDKDQFEGTWVITERIWILGFIPYTVRTTGIWRMWQDVDYHGYR